MIENLVVYALFTIAQTWPPAAPKDLKIETGSKIKLSWLDNSIREDSYRIEKKEEPLGLFTEIASLPKDTATFQDLSVEVGKSYSYRVRANQISTGFSSYSNIVTAQAVPEIRVLGFAAGDSIVAHAPFVAHVTALASDDSQYKTQTAACLADKCLSRGSGLGNVTQAAYDCYEQNVLKPIEQKNFEATGSRAVHLSYFDWDFGDATPESKYNQLRGYNAAHVYSKPGVYLITLHLKDELGRTTTSIKKIELSEDPLRKTFQVCASCLYKDVPSALKVAKKNANILLKRGESFKVPEPINIQTMSGGPGFGNDILIGAYGDGASPVLEYTGTGTSGKMFASQGASNILIRDLTLTSNPLSPRPTTMSGFGTNLALVNNKLLRLGEGFSGNQSPKGVLLQDNVSPNLDDFMGALGWIEGGDYVILGNVNKNSGNRMFAFRAGSTSSYRVLFAYNDLANPQVGPNDNENDTIRLHVHMFGYSYKNTHHFGKTQIGSLGGLDGPVCVMARGMWNVMEGNVHLDGNQPLVETGAYHARIEGEKIIRDHGSMIEIQSYDSAFNRRPTDVTLLNNVAFNIGKSGTFLRDWGAGKNMKLKGNVYVAPNLAPVADGSSAALSLFTDALSGFTEISGNVWPKPLNKDQGLIYVGNKTPTLQMPAAWNKLIAPNVDAFENRIVAP